MVWHKSANVSWLWSSVLIGSDISGPPVVEVKGNDNACEDEHDALELVEGGQVMHRATPIKNVGRERLIDKLSKSLTHTDFVHRKFYNLMYKVHYSIHS